MPWNPPRTFATFSEFHLNRPIQKLFVCSRDTLFIIGSISNFVVLKLKNPVKGHLNSIFSCENPELWHAFPTDLFIETPISPLQKLKIDVSSTTLVLKVFVTQFKFLKENLVKEGHLELNWLLDMPVPCSSACDAAPTDARSLAPRPPGPQRRGHGGAHVAGLGRALHPCLRPLPRQASSRRHAQRGSLPCVGTFYL
jgi:hypothetical protein